MNNSNKQITFYNLQYTYSLSFVIYLWSAIYINLNKMRIAQYLYTFCGALRTRGNKNNY